jgi:hypothetical protein
MHPRKPPYITQMSDFSKVFLFRFQVSGFRLQVLLTPEAHSLMPSYCRWAGASIE